uniref:Uncharacterized protein n=1 Tax=Engystomops pustulosus TaxID=76066 RepID=A0AAV6YR78_ENGPU|nr:hypothetical protein GDO81_021295 [Engystomops pustulosus]
MQLHLMPQMKGRAVDSKKKGSQQKVKAPTIIPSVRAAFCSRLKMEMFFRSCRISLDKVANSSTALFFLELFFGAILSSKQ